MKAVEEYLTVHGRPEAYKKLEPAEGAYYDGMVEIDLSAVEPMIALPFHPSEAYSIHELQQNAGDILRECEKRAEDKFGGKVKLELTSKLRTADSAWIRASSPAAPAACTTTSPRPPPYWTAGTSAAATSLCPYIRPPCR
jgi:aconitase A